MRTLTGSTTSSRQRPSATVTSDRLTTNQTRLTEQGSQTTEYALLLIVAATVAMLLLNWAQSDGGISSLLDTITGEVLDLFGIG